ncbi:hypothetical protein L207DRAFT_637551 [Hyaloscypha variabilis F]|uniref:Uncharacterized protein n=1 Tax=Hyaloscypha variabilis (strain UAMH 11265 / GT02V1 / F) TaxID=1149755 RepID=A0A2J6R9H0_HYAVF|nr:hypothetical protein L207DRAFT_637551 [Hyaloscypha variabilis F]
MHLQGLGASPSWAKLFKADCYHYHYHYHPPVLMFFIPSTHLTIIVPNAHLTSSELSNPDSLLNRAGDERREELDELGSGCEQVLDAMHAVATKYNLLPEEARSGKQLWQKFKFGNGEMLDLAQIRQKLSAHTSAITMSVNLCSLSSQGRVEKELNAVGGDLAGVRAKVNWIAANMTAKSGDESVWTSHTNDDKRLVINEGYSSSVIHKHKHLLKSYVEELGQRGVFDHETDEEDAEDLNEDSEESSDESVDRQQETGSQSEDGEVTLGSGSEDADTQRENSKNSLLRQSGRSEDDFSVGESDSSDAENHKRCRTFRGAEQDDEAGPSRVAKSKLPQIVSYVNDYNKVPKRKYAPTQRLRASRSSADEYILGHPEAELAARYSLPISAPAQPERISGTRWLGNILLYTLSGFVPTPEKLYDILIPGNGSEQDEPSLESSV